MSNCVFEPGHPDERANGPDPSAMGRPDATGGLVAIGVARRVRSQTSFRHHGIRTSGLPALLALAVAFSGAAMAGDAQRFRALADARPVSAAQCLAHNGKPMLVYDLRADEYVARAARSGRLISLSTVDVVLFESSDPQTTGRIHAHLCVFRKDPAATPGESD